MFLLMDVLDGRRSSEMLDRLGARTGLGSLRVA